MARRPQPRVDVLMHVLTLLEEHDKRIMCIVDERDRRYQERYEAQVKALDAALLSADKAVQAALSSAKEAVAKAETAAERRFENVNEFRAQLADQAATFMPRSEAEARMTTIRELVDELRTSDTARSGRGAGANQLWGLIAGGLGLLFALVATVIVVVGN